MMVNEAKLKLVDSKIEDNLDILLASFGLYGIVRSELKMKKIVEILESLFFEELEFYYAKDIQFKRFPIHEIQNFIAEERSYILAKLLK